MRKIGVYILFLGLFVYLIIVLTFAKSEMGDVKCKGIHVSVKDTVVNAFIDDMDVVRMIKRGYGNILNMPVVQIDKDSIEKLLVKNSIIKSAQVYYSLDGWFHVDIIQRKPVLRVLTGEGFYVDEDGKYMPLSRKYTSRVVVATGGISKKFACEKLYPFVMMLREDDFWDALIEQIIVDQDGDLILIPKVGNFRIVLGKVENTDEKMEKLRLFLKDGIVRKGWNLYKEINLKFDNQVVCVRK